VPYGNYKNPSIFDEDHLLIVSSLIANVEFNCQSFEISLEKPQQRDFIYLDPPYAPESNESFVGYTKDGFTKENHVNLFNLCNMLALEQCIEFVMSNANVQLVKDNFLSTCFMIDTIECKRSINSKKPNATCNEVLIRYKTSQ
jgi:DNA adenine methylase